jgi:hypothetical protein
MASRLYAPYIAVFSDDRYGHMNVTDKTVLITGATDGVGKLVALRRESAAAWAQ